MARRLPVYLLIDTSGSMSGEPIAAVKNGIDLLIQDLRSKPEALETAWFSVITFGGEAKQVVSLTSIMEFECPELITGGEAKLGAALNLVCECQEREVRKIRKDKEGKISRGDYLPIVFLFSNGAVSSSDSDLPGAIATFKSRKGETISCTVGDTPADQIIKQIADSEFRVFRMATGFHHISCLVPSQLTFQKYFPEIQTISRLNHSKGTETAFFVSHSPYPNLHNQRTHHVTLPRCTQRNTNAYRGIGCRYHDSLRFDLRRGIPRDVEKDGRNHTKVKS